MTQRTALITGGSSGIGQGIAWSLARAGYDVAITYLGEPEGADETRRGVEALGRTCYSYYADLHDPERAEYLVYQAIEALGHIDLMVCNAGKGTRPDLLTVDSETLEEIWTLNFKSYVLCASTAARHMVIEGISGNIIFITSTRATRAYPDDWLYGGLKAAMERAAEGMALQLGPHGIRVNCVAPGGVHIESPNPTDEELKTEGVPLGRTGKPQDIGDAVTWLASDGAQYITGTVVRVDGGLILPGVPEGESDSSWGQLPLPDDYQDQLRTLHAQRLSASAEGIDRTE